MNISDKHNKWMSISLSLARRAHGMTSPNPMVGAVIVKNGNAVGKGYHKKAGEAHAEINAIANAGKKTEKSSLYVTLEPCSTYGRTPPCTEAIIKAGIKQVVIGCLDPNPKHSGRGIKILQRAGIGVIIGVKEKECRELNEAFFHWITTGRPFVLLKMAMTLDGKIATEKGASKWITGTAARKRVQKLRQWADAILVGAETARIDRPALTVREFSKEKQPRRLVASKSLKKEELINLLPEGREPEIIKADSSKEWKREMKRLGKEGVTALLVEGGGELAASLLEAGVINKIEFHIAPKILGGRDSIPVIGGENPLSLSEALNLNNISIQKQGNDIIVSGYIR